MIDPLAVAGGKRIFRDGGPRQLRLVDNHVTSTVAILATYARVDALISAAFAACELALYNYKKPAHRPPRPPTPLAAP